MLTDHETRREHDEHDERGLPLEGLSPRERDAQMKFPALEEPAWLEDEADDEMEEPPDSPFRGMWIGIAAAAVTFVLVFAIPQWLGWYDIGPPPQSKRESVPESVIATVTAKPSGPAVVETKPPTVAAPPATAPPVSLPKAPIAKETKPTAPAVASPRATSVIAKETKPPAPVIVPTVSRETKPAPPAVTAPPAAAARRTFSVQIAAFKNAKQAAQLAERVKRDGYPADVRRIESSAVPYVVRIGGYASREQAESAREALARKGLKGFIL